VEDQIGQPVGRDEALRRLTALREAYEPKAQALSRLLALDLPPWMPPEGERDGLMRLPGIRVSRERRDLVG
jgi:hypothetical protein